MYLAPRLGIGGAIPLLSPTCPHSVERDRQLYLLYYTAEHCKTGCTSYTDDNPLSSLCLAVQPPMKNTHEARVTWKEQRMGAELPDDD
jgi:hypothetical protein